MKKYIIILLTNLAIKQFDIEDEWRVAIGKLRQQDKRIVAAKWSADAGEYIQQEIKE